MWRLPGHPVQVPIPAAPHGCGRGRLAPCPAVARTPYGSGAATHPHAAAGDGKAEPASGHGLGPKGNTAGNTPTPRCTPVVSWPTPTTTLSALPAATCATRL